MLYLVTTDHFLQGSPREPEQSKLMFEQVMTSIEILGKPGRGRGNISWWCSISPKKTRLHHQGRI